MIRKFQIPHTTTEPHSPWQNRAEYAIQELKKYARHLMQEMQTPIRLWCFCFQYCADILSLCATGRFELQGRTPFELVTNYTPDISEYVEIKWFQWCYSFNESTRTKDLCRWIGPAAGIGQAFCSYILLSNGEFIARSSIIPIPIDDLEMPDLKLQCQNFMQSIHSKIGTYKQPVYANAKDYNQLDPNIFNHLNQSEADYLPYGNEIIDAIPAEIDMPYLDQLDEYIGTKVVIPGSTPDTAPVLAIVKGRKRDNNGNPVGIKMTTQY